MELTFGGFSSKNKTKLFKDYKPPKRSYWNDYLEKWGRIFNFLQKAELALCNDAIESLCK
jgi:hypothetical protein